jgi:hypothetical protein
MAEKVKKIVHTLPEVSVNQQGGEAAALYRNC